MSNDRLFKSDQSEQEILECLARNNVDPTTVVKLLYVGNSGSGKSFLGNITANAIHFEAKQAVEGVTVDMERLLILPDAGSMLPPLLLYNIPGMIEVDPIKVARNKLCVAGAFRELPCCKTVGMLVMKGGAGARIDAQDVAAFKALQAFCGLKADQLSQYFCCLMNQVPQLDTEIEKLALELDAANLFNMQMQTGGTPSVGGGSASRLDLKIVESFGRNQKVPSTQEWVSTRELLLSHLYPLILRAQPMMKIDAASVIELDEDKWKKEIAAIRKESEEQMEKLKADHEANQEKWQAELQQLHSNQQQLQTRLEQAQEEARANANKTNWLGEMFRAVGNVAGAIGGMRGSSVGGGGPSQAVVSSGSSSSFPTAFSQARRSGASTFMWQGNPYTTKWKGE